MNVSREAVTCWNTAYGEQTDALFAASRVGAADSPALVRLGRAYRSLASAWRALAGELAAPLWARHAAVIAAEEFDRRARVEEQRASKGGDR